MEGSLNGASCFGGVPRFYECYENGRLNKEPSNIFKEPPDIFKEPSNIFKEPPDIFKARLN